MGRDGPVSASESWERRPLRRRAGPSGPSKTRKKVNQRQAPGPCPTAKSRRIHDMEKLPHNIRQLRPVYRLAEEHCANWCRGGLCEGAATDRTGRHLRWRTAGTPCLLGLGQRCPYFEHWVLPMDKRKETDWPTFEEGVAFRGASRIYRLAFLPETLVEPRNRLCPDCGKYSLNPRQRCCSLCRKRRRRVTNTASQQKWRSMSNS